MNQFLKVAAMAACLLSLGACGGSDDEPQIERKITVSCYESNAPKGSEFYNPKPWSYTSTMLFECQPEDMDKTASTESLAKGFAILANGQTIMASYVSNTGVINDAKNGNYTLVVYCTGNPFNAYLEKRWTYKTIKYSESNNVVSYNCCFIWEDMGIGGGWSAWIDK